MTTQFDEWLRQMKLAGKGGILFPPATRRLRWFQPISLPGNLTSATMIAQLRAAPDAATVLAQVAVGTPSYSAGRTTWGLSLAAGLGSNSTGVLPGDGDGDGVEYFPLDILLTLSGGSPDRLLAGLLPVTGYVTLPA